METERQITIGLPDGRHLGAGLFGSGNVPFVCEAWVKRPPQHACHSPLTDRVFHVSQ